MRARDPRLGRKLLLGAVVVVVVAIPSVGALSGSSRAAADTTGQSSSCPTTNPPNELILGGGTPQTAQLDTAFGSSLQVALANTNGCPVTSVVGTPITFTAPSSGASGRFATSGSTTVTVGADVSGNASAPMFTANETAGTYTVTAGSAYGSVSFSLTNSDAGIPATIAPLSPAIQSAPVNSDYAQELSVQVFDANGNPVSGATITFTLGTAGGGGAGVVSSAGASFSDGSAQATATTDSDGVATSPHFTANATFGSFTATATATTTTSTALFTLSNRAGKPATITAGIAAAEATQAGTRFVIALAVTVTDALGNKVPGALVTFPAPASGASGSFATSRHPRAVTVRSDSGGVAIAPPFVADTHPGGYVVIAAVAHGPRTAFALVNEAP